VLEFSKLLLDRPVVKGATLRNLPNENQRGSESVAGSSNNKKKAVED
jgi:hypothetical protein